MADETIQIKSNKNITVGIYFTNISSDFNSIREANFQLKNPWNDILEQGQNSYALRGNNGFAEQIIDIIDDAPVIRVEGENRFRELSSSEFQRLVKGKIYKKKFKSNLSDEQRLRISEAFINEGNALSGSSSCGLLKFEDSQEEDYNIDITIQRTFDVLETLSVKNNALSSVPNQESDTGVLFGTLYATQKIKNENGEKVKIPLANTPIVLFNPSTEFPQISSVDEDGNRIVLNLTQNSNFDDYPDLESYVLDVGKNYAEKILGSNEVNSRFDGMQPLLKTENSKQLPEKYKYSTITNDKGEFILQNVPTGSQVLMFEVDLLKQGLTKDEVALNNFPYPTDEEPNVDTVPHFYFRQIPVNIVPAWGNFQTGYTRVDISANLDLRKWGTYFVSPISFGGKTMDELLSSGYFDPLTILARDMTREGFPLTNEIVEIYDIYNRNLNQRKEWINEFKFQKPKIEFRQNNYQVFKLPANLYDPNGSPSKNSGRTELSDKNGVWLCSYQFKMFYGKSSNIYKTTGFIREKLAENGKSSNHFDINRGSDNNPSSATGLEERSSLGKFPYEKPWTIEYPEKYSIPSRPFEINETKSFNVQVEPRYFDGDLAGEYADKNSSEPKGYGLMQSLDDGQPIHNSFAQSVTKAKIYKYENNVSWHEEYSNGYRRDLHKQLFPNKQFEVKNGDKYQRVEAGFLYWLRPEGWARIKHDVWGDILLSSDIDSKYDAPDNLYPPNLIQSMYRAGETLTIKMDTSISPSWLRNGSLDIYRVIDDTPESLIPAGPPFIKKTIRVVLQNMWRNKKKTDSRLQFDIAGDRSKLTPISIAIIEVKNNGSIATEPTIGGVKERINPGQTKTFQIFSGAELDLPSNVEFNIEENFYARSSYSLKFKNSEIENSEEIVIDTSINKDAGNLSSPPTFYMITRYSNAKGNVKFKDDGEIKCKDDFQQEGVYDLNGLAFENTGSDISSIRFETQKSTPHCTTAGIEIRRIS
jgi:hypothetical protein